MKKIFVSIVFSLLFVNLHSQDVIKDIDTENFPEVSFTLHSNNPDILTKEQIKVQEEDVIDSVISIKPLELEPTERIANILFLWDLRGKESFVPELLGNFFYRMEANKVFKFSVTVFRRDIEGNKIFEPLLPSFTSDLKKAEDIVVEAAGRELKQDYPSSDIIWALDKAIDQVNAQPHEEAKAIILLTSGKNNMDSGFDISSLISKAQKNRIVIYVVNIAGGEIGATLSESLSIPTYGLFLNSEGSFATKEQRESEMESSGKTYPFSFSENETIKTWVTELPKRWEGISYKVTFVSHYPRINQTKPIVVELGYETFHGSYNVPGITFGLWVKAHWILFIIIVIISLGGIGTGLFFLVRYLHDVAEDKREKEEEIEAENLRLKTEQESLRRRIEQAESERRRKQEQEIQKEKNQKRQEYLSSINVLMKSKNIKLRLLVSTMSGSFEYLIDEPETTIGSAEDNDIVLEDTTVSRHHAILYFDGEHFGIRDMKSKNGIVMNGFKVDDLKLRNGDSVSLGKTTIKVYF